MHINEINSLEAFHALEPVWNDVLSRSDLDIPFLTFEWLSSWWKSFGATGELMILQVKNGEETIAIAPLMRTRARWRGLPVRVVSLMTNDHSFRSGVILGKNDPAVVELIFCHLRNSARSYDILLLNRLVHGTLSHAAAAAALKTLRMPFVELPSVRSPYIRVSGSWEEYLKTRSRNLRSKLKLAANQLKRNGGYEIAQYTGRDLDRAMEDVFAISRKTWKFRSGSAIANDPERMRFYRNVSASAAARGWLNLRVLRLANKPVAFALNFDYKGTSYFIKTGFDEDYRHLASSGEFLNMHAMEQCFAAGFREYDLMGKDEPYKMRLTSLLREHRKLLAFSESFYGRSLYLIQSELAPRVKSLASLIGPRQSRGPDCE